MRVDLYGAARLRDAAKTCYTYTANLSYVFKG